MTACDLLSFEARLTGVMFYSAAITIDLNFLRVVLKREPSN
jgi:hypothetical protein